MQKNGFTLVELAIALMVIGLLIGGVLKGKELIENAEVTSLVRQLKSYDAATMMFVDVYGELPGDITKPQRIPDCDAGLCIVPGNGSGIVAHMGTTAPFPFAELFNFFPHLTKAGFIQGPMGTDTMDTSQYELFVPEIPHGTMDLIHNGFMTYAPDYSTTIATVLIHAYGFWEMPISFGEKLDIKIDDGLPCTGDAVIDDIHVDCNTISSNNFADQAEHWDNNVYKIKAGF